MSSMDKGKIKEPKSWLEVLALLLRPEYVFLILSLIIGVCFAIFIPAGGNADEDSHVARVENIAHGQLKARKLPAAYSSTHAPKGAPSKESEVYGGTVDSIHDVAINNLPVFQMGKKISHSHYAFPTWKSPGVAANLKLNTHWHTVVFSGTAVNSPFVYIPFVLAYWFSQLFTSNAYAVILVMRLFGLLTFSMAIFFCIKVIPIGKWILAAVSLLPNSIADMSSVTADTLTYIACIAFITQVLLCASKKDKLTRGNWIVLTLATASLGLVKLSYLPLMILLVLIPLFNPRLRERKQLLKLCGCALAACVLFLVWYLQIHSINVGVGLGRATSPTLQKQSMLAHPGTFIFALIKYFFSVNIFSVDEFGMIDAYGHISVSSTMILLSLCFSFVLHDPREYGQERFGSHPVRFALPSFVSFICVWGLIALAEYLTFCDVSANFIIGAQSRYFLPLLPLIFIPLILIGSNRKDKDEDSTKDFIGQVSISSSIVAMTCIQVLSGVFILYTLFIGLFTFN